MGRWQHFELFRLVPANVDESPRVPGAWRHNDRAQVPVISINLIITDVRTLLRLKLVVALQVYPLLTSLLPCHLQLYSPLLRCLKLLIPYRSKIKLTFATNGKKRNTQDKSNFQILHSRIPPAHPFFQKNLCLLSNHLHGNKKTDHTDSIPNEK